MDIGRVHTYSQELTERSKGSRKEVKQFIGSGESPDTGSANENNMVRLKNLPRSTHQLRINMLSSSKFGSVRHRSVELVMSLLSTDGPNDFSWKCVKPDEINDMEVDRVGLSNAVRLHDDKKHYPLASGKLQQPSWHFLGVLAPVSVICCDTGQENFIGPDVEAMDEG
ncbi:hypothetical protein MJO28_007608 [Puccinia striiformis f. sp. tritici]|uniref:Uncharacterized protein n=5 Tax=Puccinia striiformis TaxID=27350 RepID=A0A0L0VS11_9BASI|nr:hypothetical protein MJO28_009765 [Puccinia striiformis f. sp. tritici]KAI7951924.1 hypothetical protein MJO28_007608 [Puccinia striiformis f. sp. tritici]KAI7956159.1 hypothetical protein MJO29_007558 [Puccinia striiformis f. sp. tritici]KNF02068.1 hypothetical protein PSTG_04566 [Puccinia striiformis f. sp. tritici PST-78]POW09445.1 hypothetical protein PSTT_06816 [Puccinia striiformis]